METIKSNKNLEFKCCGASPLSESLKKCLNEGYDPLFMPEIIDKKIQYSDKKEIDKHPYPTSIGSCIDADFWHGASFTSLSLEVIGKTKEGNNVIVYTHIPHYFCDPNNIKKESEIGRKETGNYPKEEFEKLLKQDGLTDEKGNRLVWVMDYDNLVNSNVKMLAPFCGGEERAEKYLEKYKILRNPCLHVQKPISPLEFLEHPQAGFLTLNNEGDLLEHFTFNFIGIPNDEYEIFDPEYAGHYKQYSIDEKGNLYGCGTFLGKKEVLFKDIFNSETNYFTWK